MTTITATERVRAFTDVVATHFADLSEHERAELLEDLEQHLLELGAEDPAALDRELADAEAYAEELRASAGLPAPHERPGWLEQQTGAARAAVAARLDRALEVPALRAAADFLPELRPAWWVLRGWLVVAVGGFLLAGVPTLWGSLAVPGRTLSGLVLGVLAVAVSVRLGQQDRAGELPPESRRVVRVLDVLGALALLGVVLASLAGGPAVEYVEVADDPETFDESWVLRLPGGEPITNLYVFDADGKLLEGVHVYDAIGQPVEVGDLTTAGYDDIETVLPRAADGTPITNRYPLEQYEVRDTGTTLERRPRTAPDVEVPATADANPAPAPTPATPAPTPPSAATPAPAPTPAPTTTPSPSSPASATTAPATSPPTARRTAPAADATTPAG